ncbi:MAG: type II toxin-antitoxin system MqsR family toxin [Thermoanaerobacterales bacterium]|nr:type II toxin-antitoxin system MqsR family toxin [Thermoanaerobacterales bacterium]
MHISPRHIIDNFLDEVKSLIRQGLFDMAVGPDERAAMIALGLRSQWEVAEYIETLEADDFAEGPKPDDNPLFGGYVWVFGPEIEGSQFYIKLKVRDRRQVFCMSFHPAKYPLRCPYR